MPPGFDSKKDVQSAIKRLSKTISHHQSYFKDWKEQRFAKDTQTGEYRKSAEKLAKGSK